MSATKRPEKPSLFAIHPWLHSSPGSNRQQLLSEDDRGQIARAASIVRFAKGGQIYNEGAAAEAVFNIVSGVVATFRALPDGDHISSFLHPGDLFGLSKEGFYTSAARATTPVVAYKMPLAAIGRALENPDLSATIIVKLCGELRVAQQHAILLSRKRATTRLAMFLKLQEDLQTDASESISEIHLPMDRSNIAGYLGLSLSAVSRAFRELTAKTIISCRDLHHVKILDRAAFNLLAETAPTAAGGELRRFS